MRVPFILVALAILVAPVAHAEGVPLGEPFILGVGEQVQVGDLPLTVTFDTILDDSRCPKDAICIWEGEATAQVTLRTPSGDSATVELHTRLSPFGPSRAEFAEHVVSLRDVRPTPTSRGPIDPADYQLELIVHDLSAVTLQPRSWSTLKNMFR